MSIRLQGDRMKPTELLQLARAVRELAGSGMKAGDVALRLGVNVKLVRRILAVRT